MTDHVTDHVPNPFAAWRPWRHDGCPYCGCKAEVFTDAPGGQAGEGDPVRCCACGLPGLVVIGDFGEESATACVLWHDDAPGCRCDWCRTHYDLATGRPIADLPDHTGSGDA